MPYLDKSKGREAVRRLRAKRHAAGLCATCGQPLKRMKPESAPNGESKPVPKPIITGDLRPCLRCRKSAPRSGLDLFGHCLRCR